MKPVFFFVVFFALTALFSCSNPQQGSGGEKGLYCGELDEWLDIGCTFSNFKENGSGWRGEKGNRRVYKSDIIMSDHLQKPAVMKWVYNEPGNDSEYSIELSDWAVSITYENMQFNYRTKRVNPSADDVNFTFKVNFSLYASSHPSERYTFQVRFDDDSDDDGKEDSSGIVEVRSPTGGHIVSPGESAIFALWRLYPDFPLHYDPEGFAVALGNGSWKISIDSVQCYRAI